jgi:hypothetical protein
MKTSYLSEATGPGLYKDTPFRTHTKFIFRYQDIVEKYSVSAETIIKDGFSSK